MKSPPVPTFQFTKIYRDAEEGIELTKEVLRPLLRESYCPEESLLRKYVGRPYM